MSISSCRPAHPRRGLAIALTLATLALPLPLLADDTCGSNSPAYPVPEYQGSTRLWPTNGFRPGRPGTVLPADRDTTQYTSNTIPGGESGHELFWAMDVVGDRLFVMYNVGLSVWDIGGANAESPRRLTVADGFRNGEWLFHSPHGEADGYLKDVAAMQDPANPNRTLIAVAALFPIGASIWSYDRVTNVLAPLYQQTLMEGFDVEMIASGGRVYAFMANGTGAYVLDVTAASTLPAGCLDGDCPGFVSKGNVGVPLVESRSRYLALTERDGKIFMANAYGGVAAFHPMPEIWEVDPQSPLTAVRRWRGNVVDTHSPVLFTKGGAYYMAVVQQETTQGGRWLRIYDVGACLDGDGCSSLPAPAVNLQLRSQFWSYHFLSYSVSEGTPFLFYGFEGIYPAGTSYERLYDLSNLGTGAPLSEITETGQTYTDPCNGQAGVGYWSSYYENNDTGYRNFCPRKGKFGGRYFYKANTGTLDVHVRTQVIQNPTVTTTTASPAPHYYGQTVRFGASAVNCTGPESWTWLSSDPRASGLGAGGNSASLTWPLCDASRCQDQDIEVWALKDACASSANLTLNRATIRVTDPRPQVNTIHVVPNSSQPDVYPVCSVLDFTADASGQSPLTYAWSIRNGSDAMLLSGGGVTLRWNTAGTTLGPEIFHDGFESGDTLRWDEGTGGDSIGRPAAKAAQAASAQLAQSLLDEVTEVGSATFRVDLVVDNPTSSPTTYRRNITLTALGDLAFVGSSPIQVTSLGGGQYRFRTNTENATRWRWEFEDAGNGTATGCQFFARCRVIDFGADDNEVTTTWAQPNVDGTYRVRVQAANCLDLPPISAEVAVPVTGIPAGAPPRITNFTITTTPHCSLSLNVMECRRTQAINFLVSHSGTATHYDFDWEGDGVFEQTGTVGTAFSHTYGTTGRRQPQVRARNGSASPSVPANLPWMLEIVE